MTTDTAPMPSASGYLQQETCSAAFANEVALAIELDEAERVLSPISQCGSIIRQHLAPTYFEY